MPPVISVDVIINSSSGVGDKEEVGRRVIETLRARDVDVNVTLAHNGAEVVELAKRAARNSSQIIVAGGGDGTISTVASAVLESDKILGVLPLGTLNHFARDLKIPLDLEAATRTIIEGRVINVDVGEVNGRLFLNNSSLMLYPSMVRERRRRQRLGSGRWPALVWAAQTALRRYAFLDVRLGADGKEISRRTPFIFVGNNEYEMERLNIGSRARLDKGELSLYMTNPIGRLGLVRLGLQTLLRRIPYDSGLLAVYTKEVWIETRRKRLRVAFDGEVEMMKPPLHYLIRPGALRVLAPGRSNTVTSEVESSNV